ncbi:MAG TPA: sigma-70 family RNA polymerase sigma factor [Pyrinomonadaceae bacterium]|nr:sigma-70 family RNA polymerase sigma factor [Pyrinomonadaceae bacterium]
MRAGARTAIHSIPDQLAPPETPVSFDEAFTLHHRAVFATARGVVRDTALAEEITQEVFLKLYRHFDSKPNDELLRAWLLRVTLNEARNMLRGQSRSRARDTTYQRKTDQPGPQVDYEQRQEMETARRALDQIKEPMRSCLLLRQQGLSYREIAQTLSLKENYVGSLIARARKEFVRGCEKVGGKIGVNR